MQVNLGRLDLLMAEPERYDGRFDPSTQQSHCGGVAQHVHADGFLTQRRTGGGRDLNVFGEPVFDGVTAERRSRPGDEKRLRWLTSTLGEPNTQERNIPDVIGVIRNFRPFPMQLTCAPVLR